MTEFDRLDQMRRDFIANASHELRTPLTVINGFLEIANSEPNLDVASREQHIKLMVEQGKRMQNLIEDMLVLTRLESIDYPVRDEFVDIRHLLDEVLIEAQALSSNRHKISLVCNGPDILGGTEELRSAFSNLVSNAIRYTPDGGEIAISWHKNSQGPAFSVKDNGIGIKQENLARLTERFYRVDKGRSRETQGTGLGLAIVKHVLMRHNARLLIESELGNGSVFTIQFPESLAPAKAA
jgi:two-component system phosphate regulon sensor histidine kinase PhoR